MSSTRSIESVLKEHQALILSVRLPDLLNWPSGAPVSDKIPYVTHLQLLSIANDLPAIRKNLQKYTKHRKYNELTDAVYRIQDTVDEYLFVNEQLMDKFDAARAVPTPRLSEEPRSGDEDNSSQPSHDADENMVLLRQRLLAGGTHTSFDDEAPDINRANEYHESIQEDIMSELTGLASSLRDSAISFSAKLLEDNKALDKTSDAMYKNETMMRQVGNNLNNYVSNKTGGKISFWFLLKTTLAVYVLFFAMVIIVKIFPKL